MFAQRGWWNRHAKAFTVEQHRRMDAPDFALLRMRRIVEGAEVLDLRVCDHLFDVEHRRERYVLGLKAFRPFIPRLLHEGLSELDTKGLVIRDPIFPGRKQRVRKKVWPLDGLDQPLPEFRLR